MILSVGEILADLICDVGNDGATFHAYCGGAPFNLAVCAKQHGAKVGFVGRVGNDTFGRFLSDFAKRAGLDYLRIETDPVRNTTLAVVSLKDGERDFAFFRHDTADFNVELSGVSFSDFPDLHIVHVGSLMLSEEKGKQLVSHLIDKIHSDKRLFSFDVNFRADLYDNDDDMINAYSEAVDKADILKFSEDEILLFTKKQTLSDAVRAVYKKDRLLLVTRGKDGSDYYFNDICGHIPSTPVTPVDTTGAGDAFFGTVLAKLDGVPFTKENIENALSEGNAAGAATTLFKGAIRL